MVDPAPLVMMLLCLAFFLYMFDFIFKRSARKSVPVAAPAQNQSPTHAPPSVSASQMALVQAEALNDDESAAVGFLLQCQFADARLKAAAHVHSRPMLEQVLQHLRNTDRRVAKLMQTRLDALKQTLLTEQEAQRCVASALKLVQEPQLMPNQVADLDRVWHAIVAAPEPMRRQFDDARSALRERLEAQAQLQRNALDVVTRLRSLATSATTLAARDMAGTLAVLAQEMTRLQASTEMPSLPRHLLPEFEQQYVNCTRKLALLEQQGNAISARHAMLEQWEADDPAALKTGALQRAWQALPPLTDEAGMAPMQACFDDLIQRVSALRKPQQTVERVEPQDAKLRFADALDGMEKALQEGALQLAVEHDKTLRAIDVKALRPSDAQGARLAKARAELTHLQGWARWGGNVSREELLKTADELPGKSLAAPDLAKKVGSLRERWKSLDASAGPGSRDLWERFDAACTKAYEPAALHFRTLADERQQNAIKAQVLIDEVRQFATTSNCGGADAAAVDWKELANFCLRTRQAWQHLGTIERKEKKRLDADFAQAMQALSDPLAQQRETEIRRREKLIAEALDLNPNDRGALDTLRNLQGRWQEQAKSLPLERKDEQALWQRFRNACDAVFAKRKEGAVAADADRRQHLQAKEALCATLEAIGDMPDAALSTSLREVKNAWNSIGPVPRASENQIEARFGSAVAAAQSRLDAVRRTALEAERDAVRDKLRLCQAAEAAIADVQAPEATVQATWRTAWQTLPVLPKNLEQAVCSRFDAALTALERCDRLYAEMLENNRGILSQELLRAEIVSGIDSPSELSRERLQLQVEVLQASLKAGQKALTHETQLLRVLALPAHIDDRIANRIERVIAGSFKNI